MSIKWPLKKNRIRRDAINNTFGMVRNGGTTPHQGWDLAAERGTICYAIADGIITAYHQQHYGEVLVLEFQHQNQTLYAAYCHLGFTFVPQNHPVKQGEIIGRVGVTGNASNMRGKDVHLHFEIRTERRPGLGLTGRRNPTLYYGPPPIGRYVFEIHG